MKAVLWYSSVQAFLSFQKLLTAPFIVLQKQSVTAGSSQPFCGWYTSNIKPYREYVDSLHWELLQLLQKSQRSNPGTAHSLFWSYSTSHNTLWYCYSESERKCLVSAQVSLGKINYLWGRSTVAFTMFFWLLMWCIKLVKEKDSTILY